MEKKISILIIDDHPLYREGLKSILGRNTKYRVIGEAEDGKNGLKMAKKLNPDLVIIDISLPDKSGIQVTHEIRSLLPGTRIIVVSMHSDMNYITESFQAGATGYVVKESASERLLQGLEAVSGDDYYLDSSISHKVVESILKTSGNREKISDADYGTLTPREQEITRLLAEGLSSREVAEKLHISPKTVSNHRSNILQKLGLRNTMELVRYAARLGLIDVVDWKK